MLITCPKQNSKTKIMISVGLKLMRIVLMLRLRDCAYA